MHNKEGLPSRFLIGVAIGLAIGAAALIVYLYRTAISDAEALAQIVEQKNMEYAEAHREALIALLNRKPIQVDDVYVSCRVTPVETYSLYVSDYWKGAL